MPAGKHSWVQGHKLKRRVGEHVQKKHHALAKHMQALRLVGKGKKGGKHRHLLPKRHRPRHNKKKLDLNKFIKGHHKPHNFMEERRSRHEIYHPRPHLLLSTILTWKRAFVFRLELNFVAEA